MKYIIIVLAALYIVSCNDDDPKYNTPKPNAILEITVYDQYIVDSTLQDTIVPNASVALYENWTNASMEEKYKSIGVTDSSGRVIIKNLSKASYVVNVKHGTLGLKQQEVNTPQNSVTKIDILF